MDRNLNRRQFKGTPWINSAVKTSMKAPPLTKPKQYFERILSVALWISRWTGVSKTKQAHLGLINRQIASFDHKGQNEMYFEGKNTIHMLFEHIYITSALEPGPLLRHTPLTHCYSAHSKYWKWDSIATLGKLWALLRFCFWMALGWAFRAAIKVTSCTTSFPDFGVEWEGASSVPV